MQKWAVSASGGFRVPLALVILVLDGFRVAGDFLLLSSRPGARSFTPEPLAAAMGPESRAIACRSWS
jgi:hypothetical protein